VAMPVMDSCDAASLCTAFSTLTPLTPLAPLLTPKMAVLGGQGGGQGPPSGGQGRA
jgi:hypothetical protein